MRISQVQPNGKITTNNSNKAYSPSSKGGREVLKAFTLDPIISTLSLEAPCDIGRGINAYKRGGFPECRERVTEDLISALFWMKGVDMFNAAGDKIGKHILKLPETEFDVGKDALRTPFENLMKDQTAAQNLTQKAEKKLSSKLAGFKFTKILGSAALTVAFMGFSLPKLNQKITKTIFALSKKKQELQVPEDAYKQAMTIDEFDKKTKKSNGTSFKGLSLTTAAHLLENNPVCKMLISDSGMMAGRCATARNADEGREYLFRDLASAFFYYASVPLIYKGFETAADSSALTSIDSVSAKTVHDNILNQVKIAGGKLTADEFKEKTLGTLDDVSKEIMKNIPFVDDVVSLEELKKYIPEDLTEKAVKMAKLQPEKASAGAVLTKQQVGDVLKNGSLSSPEFLQKIYKDRFGDSLTNPYKYIPMKQITSFRDNIDRYTQKVIDIAKNKNNGIIDEQLLQKINNKSFAQSAIFRTIAIAVSAFALGVAIPKIQYAITEKRTGSKDAPGLREFTKEA